MNALYTVKVTPEDVTEYYHFAMADNEEEALMEAAEYYCEEHGRAADTAQYVVIRVKPRTSIERYIS
tara:strand:+ start:252 stop:452 length:201 start_codon:yes stop_codon:yes gene_type:complete